MRSSFTDGCSMRFDWHRLGDAFRHREIGYLALPRYVEQTSREREQAIDMHRRSIRGRVVQKMAHHNRKSKLGGGGGREVVPCGKYVDQDIAATLLATLQF